MDERDVEAAYGTYAAAVHRRCRRILRDDQAARDVLLVCGRGGWLRAVDQLVSRACSRLGGVGSNITVVARRPAA